MFAVMRSTEVNDVNRYFEAWPAKGVLICRLHVWILKCLYTSCHCQKLKRFFKKCRDIILFAFASWNLPSQGPRFVNIHQSVDEAISK